MSLGGATSSRINGQEQRERELSNIRFCYVRFTVKKPESCAGLQDKLSSAVGACQVPACRARSATLFNTIRQQSNYQND
jgi:hypothetical protein